MCTTRPSPPVTSDHFNKLEDVEELYKDVDDAICNLLCWALRCEFAPTEEPYGPDDRYVLVPAPNEVAQGLCWCRFQRGGDGPGCPAFSCTTKPPQRFNHDSEFLRVRIEKCPSNFAPPAHSFSIDDLSKGFLNTLAHRCWNEESQQPRVSELTPSDEAKVQSCMHEYPFPDDGLESIFLNIVCICIEELRSPRADWGGNWNAAIHGSLNWDKKNTSECVDEFVEQLKIAQRQNATE